MQGSGSVFVGRDCRCVVCMICEFGPRTKISRTKVLSFPPTERIRLALASRRCGMRLTVSYRCSYELLLGTKAERVPSAR